MSVVTRFLNHHMFLRLCLGVGEWSFYHTFDRNHSPKGVIACAWSPASLKIILLIAPGTISEVRTSAGEKEYIHTFVFYSVNLIF